MEWLNQGFNNLILIFLLAAFAIRYTWAPKIKKLNDAHPEIGKAAAGGIVKIIGKIIK